MNLPYNSLSYNKLPAEWGFEQHWTWKWMWEELSRREPAGQESEGRPLNSRSPWKGVHEVDIGLPDRWEQRRKCQRLWWGWLRAGRSGSCGRSASSGVSHENIAQQLVLKKRQIFWVSFKNIAQQLILRKRQIFWSTTWNHCTTDYIRGNADLQGKPESKARKKWTSPIARKPEMADSHLFSLLNLHEHTGLLPHKEYTLITNECDSDVRPYHMVVKVHSST